MYNGIINVYKERGFTSHDVVAKLRGICGQKKIGHTGTLDPEAEGVLPVCLGSATRICDLLTDSDKEYRAVMQLGVRTDTQDLTGTVLERGDYSKITRELLLQTAEHFTGTILQTPPMYSALKVNGKKLCDLARAGITVERKSREVTIHSLRIERVELPRVEMTIFCSKGTYIRTLCEDMGEALGCKAAMESLLRTRAAGYCIEDAHRLCELQRMRDEGRLFEVLRPTEDVFAAYPALRVLPSGEKLLQNGNALYETHFASVPPSAREMPVRLYDCGGKFRALYRYHWEEQRFKPVKMFPEV